MPFPASRATVTHNHNRNNCMNPALILATVTASLLATACAVSDLAGEDTEAMRAMTGQPVKYATVESARRVRIERPGPIILQPPGQKDPRKPAQAAEGKGNAPLGSQLLPSTMTVDGVEVTVLLENGELQVITQEFDGSPFLPGQRVRLIVSDGKTRVVY